MMVLTFLISAWGQRHQLKSDLIFQLLILAAVIPWVLFGINALIDYEAAIKYRSTNDLLKLFMFLPLAWWIGGSRVGAITMLTIAFLGLITAIALDPNLMQSLSMLWSGGRVDFDIHNAQHGALFFGLVVIFCICSFSQRALNEPVVSWSNALLLLAGLVGLIGVVGTQGRAAFLGLFVSGLVAVIQGARQGKLLGQKRISARGVLVLVFVAGLLVWHGKEILHDRLTTEKPTIQALLSGNLDEVPFSSIGRDPSRAGDRSLAQMLSHWESVFRIILKKQDGDISITAIWRYCSDLVPWALFLFVSFGSFYCGESSSLPVMIYMRLLSTAVSFF
jgi:O-antigen ligase